MQARDFDNQYTRIQINAFKSRNKHLFQDQLTKSAKRMASGTFIRCSTKRGPITQRASIKKTYW